MTFPPDAACPGDTCRVCAFPRGAASRGQAWLPMLNRLTRGAGAVGLLAVLVACAHQAGSVPATQGAQLAARTPGWRITQVLPNLTIGGLWAGGAHDAWLAGDACADL